MAASYPPLLAAGVGIAGRFDQFDLYAGDSDVVTSQAQVAASTVIRELEVVTFNAAGLLVPWTAAGGVYGSATINLTGQPDAEDTVTINGVVIAFEAASDATAVDCVIGASDTETAANLVALINGTPDGTDTSGTVLPTYGVAGLAGTGVTANIDSTGLIITLHATVPGTAGNHTLTESAANLTVSGNLTGGTTEVDILADRAIGIAAQAAPSASPGVYIPYFTGGVFNHEALIWPDNVATLPQRMRAFAGTDIGVRQLL